MPTYASPNIPADTALLKVIYLKPNNDSFAVGSYNFLTTGTISPTFNMNLAMDNDVSPWAQTVFDHTYPTDMPLVYAWFFFNHHGVIHSVPPMFGLNWNIFPYPQRCISSRLCACFTRRTGVSGQNYIGRVYSSALPHDFVNGNEISPAGRALLDTVAVSQLHHWSSQGVSFIPALWSQQLGICTPLEDVVCLKFACSLYKRRLVHPYNRGTILYPVVP